MPSAEKPIGEWFSSKESGPGKGVEVKFAVDGRVLVRDARVRGEGRECSFAEFLPQAWEEFVRGVRLGEFDRPILSEFDVAVVR